MLVQQIALKVTLFATSVTKISLISCVNAQIMKFQSAKSGQILCTRKTHAGSHIKK